MARMRSDGRRGPGRVWRAHEWLAAYAVYWFPACTGAIMLMFVSALAIHDGWPLARGLLLAPASAGAGVVGGLALLVAVRIADRVSRAIEPVLAWLACAILIVCGIAAVVALVVWILGALVGWLMIGWRAL